MATSYKNRDLVRQQIKNNELALYENAVARRYKKKQTEQPVAVEQHVQQKEKSNTNFFQRVGSTVGDVVGDVGEGLFRGLEGIVDYGAGLVGALGDNDLKNKVKDFVAYDFTGNTAGKVDEFLSKHSYINDLGQGAQKVIHGVGEGVGAMLPAIAVTYFTGGAGASAAAASLAGTSTFMAQSAGQSFDEALKENADYNKALAYGTMSGAVEGGIEYLSGKLGGVNPFSKGATGKLVSGGLGKVAKTYVEEGTEEVASSLINPFLKAITYSGKYETPEIKELVESFNVGGLTALAMGGGSKAVDIAKYGKEGSKVRSNLNEINELNEKEYALEKAGKLTAENREKYTQQREKLTTEIKNSLEQLSTTNENKHTKTVNSIGDYTQTTDFDARKTLAQETVDSYNQRTGSDLKISYVDDERLNGKYDRGNNTIYISEQASNPYSVVLGHELTHSLENKKLYNELSKEILSTMSKEDLNSKYNDLKKHKEYKTLELSELDKEIVANYLSENFFTNFKHAQKLISKNKTLGQKVTSFIQDKLARISKNSKEYKELKSVEKKFQELVNTNSDTYENSRQHKLNYATQHSLVDTNTDEKNFELIKNEYKNSVDNELVSFINDVRKGKKGNYIICEVSSKMVEDIKKELNIDTSNFKISIDHNAITHITNRHGANGKADHSMQNDEDIARIEYVLNNYDKLEQAKNERGENIYSPIYMDKNNKRAPILNIEKRINGFYVVSEAVADNKLKQIRITSARIQPNKKRNNNHVSDASKNAPTLYAKSDHNIISSTNIVSQETKKDTKNLKNVENDDIKYSVNSKSNIKGLEDYTEDEINEIVEDYVISKLHEMDDYDTEIIAIKPYGSRTKGTSKESSDLDIIVEFKGDIREDVFFDLLHEDDFEINGIKVDINPITEGKSGNVEDYYNRTKNYNSNVFKDNNGKTLNAQQERFFKDSKIKNQNNELLVAYHGTDSTFYTFRNKPAQYGRAITDGFYFTLVKENASKYGKNVKEVYLNIKNPFYLHNGNGVIAELADRDYTISKLKKEFNVEIDDFGLPTPKGLKKVLQKLGYDGVVSDTIDGNTDVIDTEYTETQIVAFKSNQIKDITNKSPTSNDDIRYSVKDDADEPQNNKSSIKNKIYNYSKGQIAKYVAEHSKNKSYAKTDAEKIINTILDNKLNSNYKYGTITNKTKHEVIDTLWHALNTNNEGYRASTAMDIAEYIVNSATMESVYDYGQNEADILIIDELKRYIQRLDLSSVRSELSYIYGKDASKIYGRWENKTKNKGLSIDSMANELKSSGIMIDSDNLVDILVEMDDLYTKARNSLEKKSKELLKNELDETEYKDLINSITREILLGYDTEGHKTKFANTIEKYSNKISSLKAALKDAKEYNKAKNGVISTIERLKEEFVKNKPAGWDVPEPVVNFVKKISKVETWRNNISSKAREYIREIEYNLDSIMDDTQKSVYPYREIIQDIASGKGELTTQELKDFDKILYQFAHQLRTYDQVVFEGKAVSNTELSQQAVKETIQASKILKRQDGVLNKFRHKVYTNPYDRMAEFGLYREDSMAVRLYNEMLEGDRKRADFVKETNGLFEEFFNENKNYLNQLQEELTLKDKEHTLNISKRQAISIYLTSLREQGQSHIFNKDGNSGVIRLLDNTLATQGKMVEAFSKGRDVTITKNMIEQIKNSLTEADKKYIALTGEFFNKRSRNAKKSVDMQLYGISNIENGYYFPLKVSSDKIYTQAGQNNHDINQYVLEMGMNKSVKPKAANKLVIDGVDNIIANHTRNMSLYYGYAIPLTAYNRITNKQVPTLAGHDMTTNMRGELQRIDPDFEKYMDNLWKDMQGIGIHEKGFITNMASKIRWAGANAALGANPKVLVTQTLSLAGALSEFDAKYVAKGTSHFFGEENKKDLAKYSSLMWERMQIGNSADITEIRQIGKEIGSSFGKVTAKATKAVNDFTTKPISWMDSNAIQTLWFAAQYEIADTMGKGYEFGTEANKKEAGKRLDAVVFRTQQTSDALGRSEWMRSQNELVKFARMFTGDAVQLTGRLISSVNKYFTARNMIKSVDISIVNQGRKLLANAKTNITKSGSAFIVNQTMLLAIALAFKWIKGKDDEEWSDIAKNEMTANMMGLIPFGGDVYDKLKGYEPTNMAYTALSDTVEIASDLYKNTATLISGDYQDEVKRNASIRKTALSISKLLGVPVQNVETYMKGIIGKVSPKTREEYEALFKTKSNALYIKKIKQATENGDEELANSIINIMFGTKTGKIEDDKVLTTYQHLISNDYDILPKKLNGTLTYNGQQYTLNKKQYNTFKNTYSKSNESIKKMINSKGYDALDDEAKTKAINYINEYYYDKGLEEFLGESINSKNLIFGELITVNQLAMIVAQANVFTADKDDNGKSIAGSKKSKVTKYVSSLKLTAVQKYMIMGLLGYKNANGKELVKRELMKKGYRGTELTQMLELCGYSE